MPDPAEVTGVRESMDDYMERTKESGYPSSLRRIAWAIDEPIEKVWAQFQAARRANERGE